jgi:hypothetical protein
MLEWNPRLVTLVLVLIAIAALAGWLVLGSTDTGQYGW